MVIHAAIDGFSRLITFIGVSDNNRKETVFRLFTKAVTNYGVPSLLRCDHGGENNDLCLFMEVYHRDATRAIRGSSVHNQRIERAWVDVWKDVTNLFYDAFYFLEDERLLDPDNDVDIWALHFVYLPRIEKTLKRFKQQWNNHSLRTARSQTPAQLFVSGSLEQFHDGSRAMTNIFGNASDSETSQDRTCLPHTEPSLSSPTPSSSASNCEDNETVLVPSVQTPCTDTQIQELKRLLPAEGEDLYGFSSYLIVKEYIEKL